jgi:hypothetical protein
MKTVTSIAQMTNDWPPSVVEGKPGMGYPIKWDHAFLREPFFHDKEFVRFYARCAGRSLLCSIRTYGEEHSIRMMKFLEKNIGRAIEMISKIEMVDEQTAKKCKVI